LFISTIVVGGFSEIKIARYLRLKNCLFEN